ncbi:aldehyde dehydrogenase family protein [Lysobacter sp. HDW10]|uniref:aldehyde dehydrogenase family protein n=1 Tax=Lysobacter sp. HDW10 TaxID=2714936 RepID=UPI001407AFEB|nr:aldehyde dehydrogenase family protein [Lysobacter sp. HDW10]QIK81561.1 aldehyde dehydrogenase family protein [Lysobacter sp. HDW10]
MKKLPYYLAGKPVNANHDLSVLDKYTGEVAWKVAYATRADILAAIRAAEAAKPAMAALPAHARQAILNRCVQAFETRRDALANALCIEAGKPIKDATGEVTRLIDTFRVAASEAMREQGEVLSLQISPRAEGLRGFTKRVPIGVCSFITPFNFPLNLVAHKVAPAIAAGCPFVLKPAEKTPVGALIIAEVLAEAGLPEGAFSVLPCSNDDAAPLVEDERIALLSFTGGLIGWELKARAGRKKVTLELGGNAACIVDKNPGCDLDTLINRLMMGGYYQSGQSCISVQRLLVHEAMYDTVKNRLIRAVRALKSGSPMRSTTDLGPMIDEAAAKRIDAWMDEAESMGGVALVRGKRRGNRLAPALFEHVPMKAKLQTEEVFGPVKVLEKFSRFESALKRANDSKFGLQAGVFTADIAHAMRAWDILEVGGVVIGDVPSIRVDAMPYGGVKHSGLGREGIRYAIEDMSETRLLLLKDR